ncbi:MAG: kelch repeat-containing protein [Planctomycetota bacterium]
MRRNRHAPSVPQPTCRRLLAVATIPWLAAAGPAQDRWINVTRSDALSCPVAYDSARQRVMRVAGSAARGGLVEPRHTAHWDGSAWHEATGAGGPTLRFSAGVASDLQRRRVVLFGGDDGVALYAPTSPLADTWEWDGVQWSQLAPAVAPPARWGHAMVYDRARQRVVLFGGSDAAGLYPARSPLGDTWEWDGTTWHPMSPATGPSARWGHAMAYDPVRQRVVLFGGQTRKSASSAQGDFWEWDGTQWSEIRPGLLPPAQSRAAMACDTTQGRVLLVGAAMTWAWDGTTWRQVPTATQPTASTSSEALVEDVAGQQMVLFGSSYPPEIHTWTWDGTQWTPHTRIDPPDASGLMVEDRARGQLVHFGGWVPRSGPGLSDTSRDTHLWDGARWVLATPATTPSPRAEHGLVYDSVRGRVILYGGYAPFWTYTDTWEWDGNDWLQVGTMGPERQNHALAFDAARRRVVLFGGWDPRAPAGYGGFYGAPVAGTWEWDGQQWTERFPPLAPPPTDAHTMTYDPVRRATVMHDAAGGTWEWDGVTWRQAAAPGVGPTERGRMAFDARRARTVFFEFNSSDPVWEWDGTTWTARSLPGAPPPRWGSSFAYDSSRERLVLHGGAGLWDTWVLGTSVPAAATVFGAGCGGAANVPILTALGVPRLTNRRFAVDLGGAPAAAPAALVFSLARQSTPLAGPCVARVDPAGLLTVLTAVTGAGGAVSTLMPVPRNPVVLGTTLFGQGAVLDGSSPWLGIALTNGLELTLGE